MLVGMLFFLDFIDGAAEAGQFLLHRHGPEFGAVDFSQLNSCLQGPVGAFRAVISQQDLPEHLITSRHSSAVCKKWSAVP
jgi:hypothetical protein